MRGRGLYLLVFLISMLVLVPTAFAEGGGPGASKETPKAELPEAGPAETVDALIARADELMKGTAALYLENELEKIAQSIEFYEKALHKDPDNFEAAWKIAKSHFFYAEESRKRGVTGWQKICEEYGRRGMAYAEKAVSLGPDEPNGYYYFALNVGTYKDGVGLLTAIKEGLKDKTQKNLEKAYELDKTFDKAGVILALGRFWQVLPWPLNDKDKAMAYYREFQKTPYFAAPKNVQGHIHLAEMLTDQWGSGPKEEARKLLTDALEITDDPHWEEKAKKLLAAF